MINRRITYISGVRRVATVSATELRNDLSKYLRISEKEDVYITRNGRTIAVVSSPNKQKKAKLQQLKGCLKDEYTS